MTAKRLAAVVAFLCLIAPVATADTVILKNGVELRNVKVVEEGEHTVKINIIDYTNVILGKGKIDSIEKEGGTGATTEPAAKEPEPTTPRREEPVPQPQHEPTSHNVYKLPTNEQDRYVEVVVDVGKEGTIDVEVRPPSGEPGEKERVYTVTTEAGEKIDIVVQRDDLGEVAAVTINLPEPPRTSPKDVFEHTIKGVDGKTLEIRAKWDWNTRKLQDLQFLP
jgi:hypothetical protein